MKTRRPAPQSSPSAHVVHTIRIGGVEFQASGTNDIEVFFALKAKLEAAVQSAEGAKR